MSFVSSLSSTNLKVSLSNSKTRFARGSGGAGGKTAGRGHKGQRSRPGSYRKYDKLLFTHIPKYGFNSLSSNKRKYCCVMSVKTFLSKVIKFMGSGDKNILFNLDFLKENFGLKDRFQSLKIIGCNLNCDETALLSNIDISKVVVEINCASVSALNFLKDAGFNVKML